MVSRRTAITAVGLGVIAGSLALESTRNVFAAVPNPITVENAQTGTTGWQIGRSGFRVADDTTQQIKGYGSATSVNRGSAITFYVSVNAPQAYSIDVYRIGWYGGLGGRLMKREASLNGTTQQAPAIDSTTGLIACAWNPSYALTVPADWTSGVYVAVLTNASGYQSYISFVVRDDQSAAPILYQQSVTTYQAYNNYPADGARGKSLYNYNSSGAVTVSGDRRAVKVSFDRPYAGNGDGQFFDFEAPFVRWMERMGYDVAYSTNLDTHTNGQRLLNASTFLSVGHDEYWTKEMFDAAETARNSGVNLAFFGANEVYWQVRFEASAANVANRVMVCYKSIGKDPVKGATATARFRDLNVARPEQTLVGIQYTANLKNSGSVPYVVQNSAHWVYNGTGFKDGDTVDSLVGYEADQAMVGTPLPTNTSYTLLSRSPFVSEDDTADFANSSIYEAPGGAWVFAAGTIYWSRALDSVGYTDARIQRVTATLLDAFAAGKPALIPPSNLVAQRNADGVAVSWSNNARAITGYELERSTDASFASYSRIVLGSGSTVYLDTTAPTGVYYYRVRAMRSSLASGYSNIAASSGSGAVATATATALPQHVTIARDSFTRTVSGGWGSADLGGAYSLSGTPADYAVSGSEASTTVRETAGRRGAFLSGVSALDTDIALSVRVNVAPTGSGSSVYLITRRSSSAGTELQSRIRFGADRRVYLLGYVSRNSVVTAVGQGVEVVIPNLTVDVDQNVMVRTQVTGATPTTIRIKAWLAGQPEPSSWDYTDVDINGQIATSGSVGVRMYLSANSASVPTTFTVDALEAWRLNSAAPVATPTATNTAQPSATSTATNTAQPTATNTAQPTATNTAQPTATNTAQPTATKTTQPTATKTTQPTATKTTQPTATNTVQPTRTSTPTRTPVPVRRYALDSFNRRVSGAWGNAETGGRWSVAGGSSDFSVDGAAGIMRLPRRSETRAAFLSSVSATNLQARFRVWTDRKPGGDGPYIELHARRVDSKTLYRAIMRLNPNGSATIGMAKVSRGESTVLRSTTIPLAYVVGQPVMVRIQVSGVNPTTLAMRVWRANQSEPAGWSLTTTDNDSRLQRAGEVGLQASLSSDAGKNEVRFSFDDLEIIEVNP